MGLPRVVIIGSGFGGLFAAKELADQPVRVTLISATNHHLFQPLLYQVATGVLSTGDVSPATREILKHQRNARVLLGSVTDIDPVHRVVTSRTAVGERQTSYDSLIVAAGSGPSYFGHDEFAEHAPGMKSLDDALGIRTRVFGAFELAEAAGSQALESGLLTFVVVGAGATGVELAGQIAELAHRSLPGEFRHIDPAHARIVVIDPVSQVLPGYSELLSRAAAARLTRNGVELWLGQKVVGVDERGVDVEDKAGKRTRLEAYCKIWAAGVSAAPLAHRIAERTGAPTDRSGRILVQEDCTVPGYPDVFVVGDLMSLGGFPGVAQLAMQSGTYAARAISRRMSGQPPQGPFTYQDKGSMATVARFHAVAKIGRFESAGFFAWLLWLGIHLLYMVGFKNRLSTLMRWIISFVGRGRSEEAMLTQRGRPSP